MNLSWWVATGQGPFDYWFLAHMAFWIFVGSTVAAVGWDRLKSLIVGMTAALTWEAFEKLAEVTWPHLWQHPESFVNSWISDPATCLVGMLTMFYGYDHWRSK